MARNSVAAIKKHGYLQALLNGPQAIGKSTYASKVGFQIFQALNPNMPHEEVYDKVLDHLFFDPNPSFDLFRIAKKTHKPVPFVIYDDAGCYLSRYLQFTGSGGYQLTIQMNKLFNLIRTLCSVVILTSPTQDVLKFLREKSWYTVLIRREKQGEMNRAAIVYRRYPSITHQRDYHKGAFKDRFHHHMDNYFFKKYEEKRGVAIEEMFDNDFPESKGKLLEECCQIMPLLIENDFNYAATGKILGKHKVEIRRLHQRHTKHTIPTA